MSEVLSIILTIIAPIIIVAAIGVVLDRTNTLDARTMSRVIIYTASPSLAFYSMATATLQSHEVFSLFSYAILQGLAATIVAWLITRLLNMDRLTASAFVLAVGFMNIGNYGIPFNEFAFGKPGLERAMVVTVGQQFFVYSIGVFVASWGQASIWQSLKNAAKVPTPYAAVAGLLVNFSGVEVPILIMRVVQILQSLAIPLMLLLLGVQISRVKFREGNWTIIWSATAMRLIGGPLVGAALAVLFGLQGVSWQVGIIQAGMPTAVVTTILATEFESDPQITSSVVLVSTLLSVITLSVLLSILR